METNAIHTDAFPPAGWLLELWAARWVGVKLPVFLDPAWVHGGLVLAAQRTVRGPGGKVIALYAIEGVKAIMAAIEREREALANVPRYPAGFVDQKQALRIIGIDGGVWQRWKRGYQLPPGRKVPLLNGGKKRLYAMTDIERLRERVSDRRAAA